ncbi:hypothetical protein LCGC14_1754290 [marine sediment metagenome]|uniref:Uncharacterized protein n=1 Tax=marine sediment metagenome TaxID=412755 RepID=A0A0F9K2I9_9ZZZZ
MSVNTVPRFIEQPQLWKTQASVANTNISGNTGTLVTLLTGAVPHGSKVDFFRFQAQNVTVTNRLRIYLFTGGATAHLWQEVSVGAASASAVDKTMWSGSLTPVAPLIVPTLWTVRVAIHAANVVNIFGIGGDF